MNERVYDVAIIGAGPTGLYATFYAGMRDLRVIVFEALERPGGQLSALYPEKYIYDVGGFPAILARDLVQHLWKQARQFDAEFHFDEAVEGLEVEPETEHKLLRTRLGTYRAKAVIICAGVGAFEPNRLRVPGAAEYEGKGVHYIVRDKEAFLGRRLLVVGGGDTAVDWALELQNWAREITLIHRYDHFEAHERSVLALAKSRVSVITNHVLRAVLGNEHVEAAVIGHTETDDEHRLPVDDILICIGFRSNIGPIQNWGLDLHKRAIRTDGHMATNLPGVFAAGDITQPEGAPKINLIATGFAQAAIAVSVANRYIYPKARLFPGHSSKRKGMRYAPVPLGH
ncbi:MAG: NAD(P)/FAD-dependent oxidoreductase [Caldilineae bacterium]|nr:MAG: NAD(P)/FAD-dependent oxidoreductase [Caldilineae bacterium]